MSSEQIQSLIRHMATIFGGYLLAKVPGLTPELFEAIIGGVAAVAAVAWGVVSKVKNPPVVEEKK